MWFALWNWSSLSLFSVHRLIVTIMSHKKWKWQPPWPWHIDSAAVTFTVSQSDVFKTKACRGDRWGFITLCGSHYTIVYLLIMSKRVITQSSKLFPGAKGTCDYYIFYFSKEKMISDPIYFSSSSWPTTMTPEEKLLLNKVRWQTFQSIIRWL